MEESVRESGAIPATTAVIEGELVVGLTERNGMIWPIIRPQSKRPPIVFPR